MSIGACCKEASVVPGFALKHESAWGDPPYQAKDFPGFSRDFISVLFVVVPGVIHRIKLKTFLVFLGILFLCCLWFWIKKMIASWMLFIHPESGGYTNFSFSRYIAEEIDD